MSLGETELLRLRLLGIMMFLAAFVLLCFLWKLQVREGVKYADSHERQSVRRVRIPAMRGRIYDRNGACLADNRANYCVSVYLEELWTMGRGMSTIAKVSAIVNEISALTGAPAQVTSRQIEEHLRLRKPLPLVLWRNADERMLARIAEAGARLPGVAITVEPVRRYPLGSLAAHVLGYVGRSDLSGEEETRDYHYYLPEIAGKQGLERRFDRLLAGQAGGSLVQIDVSGFQREELGVRPPVPGGDLLLALDARIQGAAERALGDFAGAAVVIDPRSGDVLALASSPAFDLNLFCPSISRSEFAALVENRLRPLYNRAALGVYPPGSIFKPVVLIAALESGRLRPDDVFDCPGYFPLGNRSFACFLSIAHGAVDYRRAIEVSCNVFFYRAGLATGYESIRRAAGALGLGRKTGIEIDESGGLVPDAEWKRRQYNAPWVDGDTCNVAIGQGALGVTPLQMACAAAAIANGGALYQPRLVIGERAANETGFRMAPPRLARRMGWSAENTRRLREAMRDVIHSPSGSGRLAAIEGVEMAGKTGTAEYGRKADGRKHGWMIVFAPFDRPRYAAAMMLDDAQTGGSSVGPRIHDLMAQVFALEKEREN